MPRAGIPSNSAARCSGSSLAIRASSRWRPKRQDGANLYLKVCIAVAQSFGSYVAGVAEVSVDKSGQPKVHRVIAAVDCGQSVNPEIVKRQCESAIVFGLTAALYGRTTFKNGEVE
jgi:CO/xanthine dehydrogenase Mo-binding subunit